MISPFLNTNILSAKTVDDNLCEINRQPLFFTKLFSFLYRSNSAIGSSADVGSSRIINFASLYKALAIAIFCPSPPDGSKPDASKILYTNE